MKMAIEKPKPLENFMSEISNKERFTLNFRKNPVVSVEEIHQFLEKINNKKFGKEVTLHEVIADCVHHYSNKEIKRLQHDSMTPLDKIRQKYEEENQKSEVKLSFEEYLAIKLKIH